MHALFVRVGSAIKALVDGDGARQDLDSDTDRQNGRATVRDT